MRVSRGNLRISFPQMTSLSSKSAVNRGIASYAAAVVLFIAASAKFQQSLHDSLPAVMLIFAAVEFLLAVWLSSGWKSKWSSRIALFLFSVFAIVVLIEIHQRTPSCGCFGAITVQPTRTFFLDLTAIIGLVLQQNWTADPHRFQKVGVTAAIGVLGVCSFVVAQPPRKLPETAKSAASTNATVPPDAIASAVSSTEWVADIGLISRSKTVHILFNLTDPLNRDLQVRGVNVPCGCTSVPHPPSVIRRMATTAVEVVVNLPDRSQNFETTAVLTTDAVNLPPLTLHVRARTQ